MKLIDQESAVAKFFLLARECRDSRKTAVQVASLFADIYRDMRIAGDEGAAILLQWGKGQSPTDAEFSDARKAPNEKIEFEEVEAIYFSFNPDNAILPPSAAQLVRRGVLSPKTRFTTILRFATKLPRESVGRDIARPLVRRLPRPKLS
jgi:hypothetical protein